METSSDKPIVERMRPEDSNFIPEHEIDPDTGQEKKRPFQQKPYEASSEFGG